VEVDPAFRDRGDRRPRERRVRHELRSAPVRATPLRCCHRATGMPRPARRSEQTGTWKPPPPKRRGASSIPKAGRSPATVGHRSAPLEPSTRGTSAPKRRRSGPEPVGIVAASRDDQIPPQFTVEAGTNLTSTRSPTEAECPGTPPRCRHRCGPVLPESIRSRSSRRLRAVDLHGVVDVKERSEERSLGR
jgi:hypothetical protein